MRSYTIRNDAEACWKAGLDRLDADHATSRALQDWQISPTLAVATGKAAPAMARAVRKRFPSLPLLALALEGTPGLDREDGEIRFSDHPLPSPRGIRASQQILDAVKGLGPGETLLYLLSGGSSAMFELPQPPIGVDDLIKSHGVLVGSGLPIEDINFIRCLLSAVKGGGLARAARPARVVTLAISDVPGDLPAAIGSGPSVPFVFEPERLAKLHAQLAPALPTAVSAYLNTVLREGLPKQKLVTDGADGAGEGDQFSVIASGSHAAEAAADEARRLGYEPCSSGLSLVGDATAMAATLAESVEPMLCGGRKAAVVLCGETTVAPGAQSGRGGRNVHLALALAGRLAGRPGWCCVSAGSDGVDGTAGAAGAVVDGESASRVRAGYGSPGSALAAFDAGAALEASGDLLVTGPTGTNVSDLLVFLCDPDRSGAVSDGSC